MSDLLAAAERVADNHWNNAIGQTLTRKIDDSGARLVAGQKAVNRKAERRFDNEPVALHDLRHRAAQRRAQLDIARVNQPLAPVLDQQLGRAENMAGRMPLAARRYSPPLRRNTSPRIRSDARRLPACVPYRG